MSNKHKGTSSSKKGLSAFEKAFAAARKKAGGPGGIFTFKVDGKDKKFTTAYKGEKIPKKIEEKVEKTDAKKSGVSKTRMEGFEPKGKSKTILEVGEAKKRAAARFKGKGKGVSGGISITSMTAISGDNVPPKPKLPIMKFKGRLNDPTDPFLIAKRARKEWEKTYGATHNNDGTPKKTNKKSAGSKARRDARYAAPQMNVGGLTSSAMQNGLSRKINPSTGLTMNKGGMTDYRKSGMFYGGGMTRRGK